MTEQEQPAEHCRTAMAILDLSEALPNGSHVLSVDDYHSIMARLARAVVQLEHLALGERERESTTRSRVARGSPGPAQAPITETE